LLISPFAEEENVRICIEIRTRASRERDALADSLIVIAKKIRFWPSSRERECARLRIGVNFSAAAHFSNET